MLIAINLKQSQVYALDLRGTGLGVAHDTSSYYYEHLCNVISKSIDEWPRNGLDTKCDRRMEGAHVYIPPFLGKGRGQKAEFLRMQIYRLADSLNIQNLVAEFF